LAARHQASIFLSRSGLTDVGPILLELTESFVGSSLDAGALTRKLVLLLRSIEFDSFREFDEFE
jgi:hypothetical protein